MPTTQLPLPLLSSPRCGPVVEKKKKKNERKNHIYLRQPAEIHNVTKLASGKALFTKLHWLQWCTTSIAFLLVKTYTRNLQIGQSDWLNAGNPAFATLERNQVYPSVASAAAMCHWSQRSIIVTLWTGLNRYQLPQDAKKRQPHMKTDNHITTYTTTD